jgi:hypothetical protein
MDYFTDRKLHLIKLMERWRDGRKEERKEGRKGGRKGREGETAGRKVTQS